jgi:hypothetical protein
MDQEEKAWGNQRAEYQTIITCRDVNVSNGRLGVVA